MVYFQTKNPNLGKFWMVLEWKIFGTFYVQLEYITAVWYILGLFGNLVSSCYMFFHFGIFYQEKSGNPVTV
jgi:hypothetical protein